MAVKRFLKMGMGTISREWGGDGVTCSSPCQSLQSSNNDSNMITNTMISLVGEPIKKWGHV